MIARILLLFLTLMAAPLQAQTRPVDPLALPAVVDLIGRNGETALFADLLKQAMPKAAAGQGEALACFVPPDAAFRVLTRDELDGLRQPVNAGLLEELIAAHCMRDGQARLRIGVGWKPSQPQALGPRKAVLLIEDGAGYALRIDGEIAILARLTAVNQRARDGIIHHVDRLLLPDDLLFRLQERRRDGTWTPRPPE